MDTNPNNANGSGGQEGANANGSGQAGQGGTGPNANGAGIDAETARAGGEGTQGKQAPETVPYGRFSEQNAALKAAQAELAKRDTEAETARQAKLKEDGDFQKIIDEQTPKVERATKLEAVVQKSVDTLLEKIPEDMRSLVPESLSPEDKLDYIHTNFDRLTVKEGGQTINRGTNPGGKTTSTKTFTGEQISDPKFYRENREEILQAQKEGRITT